MTFSEDPSSVQAIVVTITVAQNQVLHLMLDDAGGIRRQGTGKLECAEGDLLIGATTPKVFAALIDTLPENLLAQAGRYCSRNTREGVSATLNILFQCKGTVAEFEFQYGSISPKLPQVVQKLVADMIDLTNPWYEKHKANVRFRSTSSEINYT